MKTGYGYKLFEMDTFSRLYPLFIGKNKETKVGEWILLRIFQLKIFQ